MGTSRKQIEIREGNEEGPHNFTSPPLNYVDPIYRLSQVTITNWNGVA